MGKREKQMIQFIKQSFIISLTPLLFTTSDKINGQCRRPPIHIGRKAIQANAVFRQTAHRSRFRREQGGYTLPSRN